MRSSKAQITVFVILGILLLVVVGIFIFLQQRTVDDFGTETASQSKTQDISNIEAYVDACVQPILKDTTRTVAATSFFFENENLQYRGTPYYYFVTRSFLPNLETVQRNYADFLKPQIESCLDNFSSFQDKLNREIILNEDYLSVQTNIGMAEIKVITSFDGILSDGVNQEEIASVITSTPSSVGKLYKAAELVIDMSDDFCLDCIGEYANEQELFARISLGSMYGDLSFTFIDYYPLEGGDTPMYLSFLVKV